MTGGIIAVLLSLTIAGGMTWKHNKSDKKGKKTTTTEPLIPRRVYPLIAWIIFLVMCSIAEPLLSKYYFSTIYFWMFQIILWINTGELLEQHKTTERFVAIVMYCVLISIFILSGWSATTTEGHNWIIEKENKIFNIIDKKRIRKKEKLQKKLQSEIKIKKPLENLEKEIRENPLNPNITVKFTEIKKNNNTIYPLPLPPKPKRKPPSTKKRAEIVKTFDIPANTVINTGLKYNKDDRIEFKKYPHNKNHFWIMNSRKNLKITSNTFATKVIPNKDGTEGDEIKIKGGNQNLRVEIKIISNYYL